MKILLADPETNIRYGLKTYFEALPEFSITGEVENPADLFRALQACSPDIILLSLKFPEVIHGDIVDKVKKLYPDTKILGMDTDSELKQYAASIGTDGFVSKADQPEKLITAIKESVIN